MKALTALLGYLSVLLEYIDLYHGFQPMHRLQEG